MKRLTVLMVFGGESSEHEVSIDSARNVYGAIDKSSYDVNLAYIDKSGRWWLLSEWTDTPDEHSGPQLVAAPGTKYFLTVPESNVISVDVLFPVLHGKDGEDGTIQGLAQMLHIPVVGCGVEASAICMNKDATKRLLAAANIPVVPWRTVVKGVSAKEAKHLAKELSKKGPWFVKPSRAGSSIGVSKVEDLDALRLAIEKAHQHDSSALIETAVIGRDLEVAVLGNSPHHKASGIGEIVAGADFYDYDDKYAESSAAEVKLDAKLPKALTKVIRQSALDAYEILGCQGLARVDFLLDDDLTPYINELNTLPGFTNISMYPKLWQEKGVSYSELVDRLIKLALE
jgi:D-alanine-D-alanine ligase